MTVDITICLFGQASGQGTDALRSHPVDAGPNSRKFLMILEYITARLFLVIEEPQFTENAAIIPIGGGPAAGLCVVPSFVSAIIFRLEPMAELALLAFLAILGLKRR
jgi:hypothetical protein